MGVQNGYDLATKQQYHSLDLGPGQFSPPDPRQVPHPVMRTEFPHDQDSGLFS